MKTITIGRTPDNTIVIDDGFVSKKHASITLDVSGRYTLQDLGSSNGTFINGMRVQQAQLQYNDVVKVGNSIIPWQSYFKSSPGEQQGLRGKVIRTIRIGRSAQNDVVLSEDLVSGSHAVLVRTDLDEYEIQDIGSTNGTFVNERKVQQPTLLFPGDVVKIGRKTIDWMGYFISAKPVQEQAREISPKVNPVQRSKPRNDLRILFWSLAAVAVIVIGIILAIRFDDGGLRPVIDPQGEEQVLLPEAPEIPSQIVVLKEEIMNNLFKQCQLSGDHKQLVQACDFNKPAVRNMAVELAGKSPGKFNIGQVCEIFDHCYKNWKYVNDPQSNEFISSASNTISAKLSGDCDDFAILMNSLILAIGGNSCINYAYNESEGHAYAEVCLGKDSFEKVSRYLSTRYASKLPGSDNRIHYRTDAEGQIWLNLDWSAEFPGGDYFKATQGRRFYILNNYCEDF